MSLLKAIRLEFNYLKERWISTLVFFLASALFVVLFALIAKKIPVTLSGFSGLGFTYYDLLSTIVFPLLILFVSVQTIILRIVGERAPYGTLDRELIAISRNAIYFGKLIVHFIIIMLQCLIIYLFGFILFPVKSNAPNSISIILFFFILGLFGLSLGLMISIFSKQKETAVQTAPYLILILFIVSLILILQTILPAGVNISSSITTLISNNPFALVSQPLFNIQFKGQDFDSYSFMKESLWVLFLITVSLLKFNSEKK